MVGGMAQLLDRRFHTNRLMEGKMGVARKPRLETRNGIYHVMAKGNDGRLLFRQPADFNKFVHLINDSRGKDPHVLLSFCLMPNHIHLLLETTDTPLSKIMHRLLLRYSIYFNKKYSRTGHLFQNRFKARLCKDENYLLQLLVYIHDNPRKAGLVDEDRTYPYSSEATYQRRAACSAPVNNIRALELIGPSSRTAWKAYHHHLLHIRSQKDKFPVETEIQPLEGPSFFPDNAAYLDPKPDLSLEVEHDPGKFDFLKNVPLGQMCEWVADIMGVERAAVQGKGKGRHVSRAKSVFIFLARKTGWRPIDLIREFGFNPGTIAYHWSRYEEVFDTGERERVITELQQIAEGQTVEI